MSGVALTVLVAAGLTGLAGVLAVLLVWLDQRRQE
jgi:hypothetical protein